MKAIIMNNKKNVKIPESVMQIMKKIKTLIIITIIKVITKTIPIIIIIKCNLKQNNMKWKKKKKRKK